MPHLLGIAGPLTGREFPLTGAECSLGRAEECGIRLDSPAISRRHCVIRCEELGFVAEDLESRNGMHINGVRRLLHVLQSGDELRIGEFAFQYVEERVTVGSGADALLQAASLFAVLKALEPRDTPARRLLMDRLLSQLVQKLVPAEHVAVLLTGEGELAENLAIPLSRKLIRQVLERGETVLLSSDNEVNAFESLHASETRSVIAVPLLSPDLAEAGVTARREVLGLLYAATASPVRRFTEDHLQIVSAVGVLASTALENRRLLDWLSAENERLTAEINLTHDMVGDSQSLRELLRRIERVAPADTTVLILGESGTGKELVARAVHRSSQRALQPFVAVNCAALTESLLESELFGHEKGAFTGAVAQKRGKLEAAAGGTVFLDEVGEMSPILQAKMLRVLQERECERVGGTRTIKLDFRLVAATNRDLRAEVRAGRFREDLYYRLNGVALATTPLRERRDDVLKLSHHFLRLYAGRVGRTVSGFAPRTQRLLLQYDWPGNVRELQNAIERAVVMGSASLVQPEDLPEPLQDSPAQSEAGEEGMLMATVREAKRQVVLQALAQTGGNFTRAAELLGVHPNYLHRLANQLQLRPGQARPR